MRLRIYKKNFKVFNGKVVVCELRAGATFMQNNGFIYSDIVTTKGRAKCHPDDEFNEEEGKKLAFQRAKENAYRKINKNLIKHKEELDQYSLRLGEISNSLLSKYDPKEAELESILLPFSNNARNKVRRILELFDKMDEYDKKKVNERPTFRINFKNCNKYLMGAQKLMLNDEFWTKVEEYATDFINNYKEEEKENNV